jgi:hypothetical protein
MPLGEVNRVIGNDGEWITHDYKYRTSGGHYHEGDRFYKWGPDRKGGTYVLGFREGHLINFDPRDFREEVW